MIFKAFISHAETQNMQNLHISGLTGTHTLFCISRTRRWHASTQAPHPLHFSGSTVIVTIFIFTSNFN
jgi:hypothetical protein